MPSQNFSTFAGAFAVAVISLSLTAQERGGKVAWNRFRGPNGQGTAEADRIPIHFGPDSGVLWKTAVPRGNSSPVIWNDRIFLTAYDSADERKLITLCIHRRRGTGLWRRLVRAERKPNIHSLNCPAAPTPAVDEKHVYVYFGTYGLICYDHKGTKVWQRRIATPRNHFGVATSPILHKDKVIMVLDDNGGRSRLLAVNRDTGRTVWQQPRSLFKAGWSTPMIWRHDGADELVVLGYKRLTSYDPSTGREIWWAGGFSEETMGTPVAGGGLLFASTAAVAGRGDKKRDVALTWKITVERFDRNHDNQIQRAEMTRGFTIPLRPELPPDNPGYGLPIKNMDALMRFFDRDGNRIISEREWTQAVSGFAAHSRPSLLAVRPGAKGDARPSHVAWEIQRGIPEVPSPLYWRGRLYLFRDGGRVLCLRAATGKELFSERIGTTGQYLASPIAAGDKILIASVRGTVTIIQADDKLKILAKTKFTERIFATPAVADNKLYLRTTGHLYAFGQAKR